MKNLAILPDYFDYIFVHLRQKVRLRPESSPTFLSTLSPNPNPTRKARPDLQLCASLLRRLGFSYSNAMLCNKNIIALL